MRVYHGKAIVNSVNGDEESLKTILRLSKVRGSRGGADAIKTEFQKMPMRFEIAQRVLTARWSTESSAKTCSSIV